MTHAVQMRNCIQHDGRSFARIHTALTGAVRPIALLILAVAAAPPTIAADALVERFLNPPPEARPYVWWHWMGSNFSLEGISKDLESMREAGIGGATVFNLSSGVEESHAPIANSPWPHQTYRSEAYWRALRHAASEADRLGLEIGLHNTVGYSTTGGPWIDERRSMQRLVWSETRVDGGRTLQTKLPQPELIADEGWGKTGRTLSYYKDVAVLAAPNSQGEIALDDVLLLSNHMTSDGTLQWDAPKGSWSLYRLGHASTGRPPHPVPDDLLGKTLEADKLSEVETRHHWDNVIQPTKAALGELYGKSFRHFLIDSYEAGEQNWTEDFREQFLNRKGYDPLPWILTFAPPVVNGDVKPSRIIGSKDHVARFQWDYRDVVQQLYEERGWRPAAEMIESSGAQLHFEPYGGPFDSAAAAAIADVPMVEFWTGGRSTADPTIVGAGRAAGRRVIAAEAFTSRPERSQWTETPAELKADGDAILASGVNRLVLHHWVHQPFDDRHKPGMGMGWWGTHFGRNQTWYEPGKAFVEYLWRTQSLLQYGHTPVEVLSVGTSHAGSDVVPWTQFLAGSLAVEDGSVVTPSGRRYRLVHVPHEGSLLPSAVAEIDRLLHLGANVCASRPVRSPSLQDYPQCDQSVQRLAEEIWARYESAGNPTDHGVLYGDGDLNRAVGLLGLSPRLVASDARLRHLCREGDEGTVFFVANPTSDRIEAAILATGEKRRPELWEPETSRMRFASIYRSKPDGVETPLSLGPGDSVFLVFRGLDRPEELRLSEVQGPPDLAVEMDGEGEYMALSAAGGDISCTWSTRAFSTHRVDPQEAISIEGPWAVQLSPAVGPDRSLEMQRLSSFTDSEDPSVKYFSGAATYTTSFVVERAVLERSTQVVLSLGEVGDLAEAWVNGKSTGVMWRSPMTHDVRPMLLPGSNEVRIVVWNTWHNRMVGDEQFEADFSLRRDRGKELGRGLAAFPKWLLDGSARPSANRITFTTWIYHRPETQLRPAGLIGPVRLTPFSKVTLTPGVSPVSGGGSGSSLKCPS